MVIEALELAKETKRLLESKKAERVVILDVSSLSNVTNYFVIAVGMSAPHIKALAGIVERGLKDQGLHSYRSAGTAESGWCVVDLMDVVVHVFTEEMCDYYALERLWSDAVEV